MARVKYVGTVTEWEKEFLRLFNQLTCSRSAWQVWEDLMTVMACSICNAVDRRKEPFERREKQYERPRKRRYSSADIRNNSEGARRKPKSGFSRKDLHEP